MNLLTKILTQHLSSTHFTVYIDIEFNKPAFLCFVDLFQAFNKVQLKEVLKLCKNDEPRTI